MDFHAFSFSLKYAILLDGSDYMDCIYGLTISQLENYLIEKGEKPFRAIQIYEWLYRNKIQDFAEMTNVKKSFIEELKQDFLINILECVTVQKCTDGTIKFLFKLADE